jgi:hypothetical protein
MAMAGPASDVLEKSGMPLSASVDGSKAGGSVSCSHHPTPSAEADTNPALTDRWMNSRRLRFFITHLLQPVPDSFGKGQGGFPVPQGNRRQYHPYAESHPSLDAGHGMFFRRWGHGKLLSVLRCDLLHAATAERLR